jgi:16S rRNA (guanine527-N7)-methyltransferase
MPYLIDETQIREALSVAGLSYVEHLNANLPAQLSIWLNMMLAVPRNLTAIRDPAAAIEKHVIEPLTGRHRLIDADLAVPNGTMIDIGSGNGAPGLPLALCDPARQAMLLDSRSGAAAFLRDVTNEIGANRIAVIEQRAEVAAHAAHREHCTLVVSRAAANPPAAMELMIPYLRLGGVAAAWTGELSTADLERVGRVIELLGAELTPIDAPSDIVVATKVRPTDAKYPRSWNQIRRRPLDPSR